MLTPASGVDPGDLDLKSAPVKVTEVARKLPVHTRFGTGAGPETYLVTLDKDAVPTGELAGQSANSYASALTSQQSKLRQGIAGIVPGSPQVLHTYTHALNGVAVRLTATQARRVAELPEVQSVTVERTFTLTSDAGAERIGAPQVWDGTATGGVKAQGEGMTIGVIDSGINPANPSFATTVSEADGGDGYVVKNPKGKFFGMCDPANAGYEPEFTCTDKLIGAYQLSTPEINAIYDDNGHGSHTASTAAGNKVRATMQTGKGEQQASVEVNISGVAPHANIISYDTCTTGCLESDLVAGINQAIKDKVDAINFSIGGPSFGSLWNDPDSVAMLNARAAGIHVANSAGNEGPTPKSVGAPAVTPWVLSVGASTHQREFAATVRNIKAGSATLPDIGGVGFSASVGESPLVDADAVGDRFCTGRVAESDVKGKIVLCMRGGPAGSPGRVEKGVRMAAKGAAGMILTNDEASGNSTISDTHAFPATLVTWTQGEKLRAFLKANPTATASIQSGEPRIDEALADKMGSFSSRGPNPDMMGDTLVPSVTAPGVDILAAYGSKNEVKWSLNTGTSMSSPHVAGALLLVKQVHPTWTPAQVQSALMTTAFTDVHEADGSPATPFAQGAGRIDVSKALNAGLLLDVSKQEYLDAQYGGVATGEPGSLNTASFVEGSCLVSCSWSRTLTGTANGAGDWKVSVSTDSPELRLSPSLKQFTMREGKNVTFALSATLADGAAQKAHFGMVTMTPADGSTAPAVHFPVAVTPEKGQVPAGVLARTSRTSGTVSSSVMTLSSSTENLKATVAGAVKAQRHSLKFRGDTMRDTLFDKPGSQVVYVDVPAGTEKLVAFADSSARRVGVFVGRGSLSTNNVVCTNTPMIDLILGMTMFGDTSAPSCTVSKPKAGRWWVAVQNQTPSETFAVDTVDLFTGFVRDTDAQNIKVIKPAQRVIAGEPFSLDFAYDLPTMKPGETYLAAVSLTSGSADYGVLPVAISRSEDVVTQTADVSVAKPGQKVNYTVTVPPSLPGTATDYDITSVLPAGLTYVAGSATDGAVESNGTVAWKKSMGERTPSGVYNFVSEKQDGGCMVPVLNGRDWTDLNMYGMTPIKDAVGDSRAWRIASDMKFYGQSGQDLYLTDDGVFVFGQAPVPGSTATPQALPDAADPNNVLAPLWQDMELTYAEDENGIQTKGVSVMDMRRDEYADGWLVVQVLGAQLKSDPTQTYDFQVWFKGSGEDFVISYGPLGTVDGASVGSEDATAGTGYSLKKPGATSEDVVKDSMVCAKHTPGGKAKPASYSFAATVDAKAAPATVLKTVLTHRVDTPNTRPETVTTPVTVAGKATITQVKPALTVTAPKKVKVRARGKVVTATVKAGGASATGRVQVSIKGAGKKVLRTLTLKAGKVSTALPRFTKKGKVTVTVKYLGTTAVTPAQTVRRITVIRR